MRERVICTANGGKTYEVTFDGDAFVSVDVVQKRMHADGEKTYNRRLWTRGRSTFGSPVVEEAKRAGVEQRARDAET